MQLDLILKLLCVVQVVNFASCMVFKSKSNIYALNYKSGGREIDNDDPITLDVEIGYCYWENIEAQEHNIETIQVFNARPPLTTSQFKWLTKLGREAHSRTAPVIRKEYRMMSKNERLRFHKAMWSLRDATFEDGTPLFDTFGTIHHATFSPGGVRTSPAQYGWHREYVLLLEQALIDIDSEVYMPYWDLGLDAYITDAADAGVWDQDFAGPCGGVGEHALVAEGTFAYFPLSTEIARATLSVFEVNETTLLRSCITKENKIPFTDPELIAVFEGVDTLSQLVDRDCFVKDHDLMHHLIGGTTRSAVSAVIVDPVSWMMHAFVDLIWEVFRNEIQTAPETDYPEDGDISERLFRGSVRMAPFNWVTNIGSMTKNYTESLFLYETVPISCSETGDCQSDNLFCMTSLGRCQSKMRESGDCSVLGSDACMSNYCNSDGKCAYKWV